MCVYVYILYIYIYLSLLDSQHFSHFCMVSLKSSYDATVTLKIYRHVKEATNLVSKKNYFHGKI